jgi:hypothetical protein
VATLVARADGAVWAPPAAAALAELALNCVARDEEDRPQSVVAVVARLRALRPHAAAVPPPPLVKCLCDDAVAEAAGIRCGGGARHFACVGCFNMHVRSYLEPGLLAGGGGRVPCVKGVDCAHQWDLDSAEPGVDKATYKQWAKALQAMAIDAPREKAEREAALAAAEAAALRERAAEARARALRVVIVDRDLKMCCPRCALVFVEYSGCNALTCPKCAAGFCAVCLKDCGNDAHPHIKASAACGPDYFNRPLFDTEKRKRFLARVVASVAGLAGEGAALQRAVVAELGKADLRDLGISEAEVLAGAAVKEGGGGGEWACPSCTLVNAAGAAACGICATPRNAGDNQPAAQPSPTAAMGAARVVALMRAGAVDAGVVRAGAEALRDIAVSDAGRAACVAERAPAAVVAALANHAGVAAVCERGCAALVNITANNDAAKAACVAAGAPAAVVAALITHADVAAVCELGCWALGSIAVSDAGRAACVASRAPAALVAALTTHAASSNVCLQASWALLNIAWSDSAHRAAIVAAGAVAPLAAALARYPGAPREKAHAALEKLGYTDSGESERTRLAREAAEAAAEERLRAEALVAAQRGLPPGWRASWAGDPPRVLFFHEGGASQWERPAAPLKGRCVGLYQGNKETVTALAFVEGAGLVGGSTDEFCHTCVWAPDMDAWRKRGSVSNPKASGITALPNGWDLASAGFRVAFAAVNRDSDSVQVWGLDEGARSLSRLCTRSSHSGHPYLCVAATRDYVACGGSNGDVGLWDHGLISDPFPPFGLRDHLKGHAGAVRALASLPDGRLASGGDDKTIRLWNVARCDCTQVLQHQSVVLALAVLDGGRLASGCDDNRVHIWSLAGGVREPEAALAGHTSSVLSLAALPRGLLASGSSDRTVRVWDVGARACVAMLEGHGGGVPALAALPDGCLASGSSGDPLIRVWALSAPGSPEDALSHMRSLVQQTGGPGKKDERVQFLRDRGGLAYDNECEKVAREPDALPAIRSALTVNAG